MTKIIGIENTERINAELEQLMEDVRQRTKATITGVKIPDLGEAQAVDGTEMLIIEGKNGTTVHQTLKDRLDADLAKTTANTNQINNILNAMIGYRVV